MSDNTRINVGQDGNTIATEDVGGGVQAQRIKVMTGASHVDGGNVTTSNPFPTQELHPSSAAVSQVASSASSTSLIASNSSRKGLSLYNDSTQILYVLLGTGTASSTNYSFQLGPNGYYEEAFPCYTGQIKGIWASANGYVYVTEKT